MTALILDHQNVNASLRRRSRRWLRLGAILIGIDLLAASVVVGGFDLRMDPGVALGVDSATNPLSCLGSTMDQTGCVVVPLAIGDGYRVICPNFSAITTLDDTVQVVSIYAGTSVFDEYTGPMPEALRWHQGMEEIADTLGDPWRITSIYGTPTLVYMYDDAPYGSLELRFDYNAELVQINACLDR